MTPLGDLASLEKGLADAPRPLALVPTMGALHDGHLSLIRMARESVGEKGSVLTSIFVNPIQFDRAEDLSNYPRPLEEDLAMAAEAGSNLAFTPEPDELYHPDRSVLVSESLLTNLLCGETRPGHFDGVLTVITKLFNLCQPEFAVFGKKDFQQLALINRLVRDLNFPVTILPHPTVREDDGLAMSSRNRKLTPKHRADAPRIHRALAAARDLLPTGEQDPQVYLRTAKHHLLKDAPSDFKIDYLELVDAVDLQRISRLTAHAVLATACFFGPVRLIDHLELNPI